MSIRSASASIMFAFLFVLILEFGQLIVSSSLGCVGVKLLFDEASSYIQIRGGVT